MTLSACCYDEDDALKRSIKNTENCSRRVHSVKMKDFEAFRLLYVTHNYFLMNNKVSGIRFYHANFFKILLYNKYTYSFIDLKINFSHIISMRSFSF